MSQNKNSKNTKLTDLNQTTDEPSKSQNMDLFESSLIRLNREGVSINNRKIYIPEIDLDSPLVLIEFLDYIMQYSKPENRLDPVELLIGTYGGSAYGMLGTIDIMRTAPMKINTTAIGAVMSAGTWVLAAGTGVRRAHENTFIMLHQLRGGQDGTMHEIAQTTTHLKKVQQTAERLLAKYTKKDEKFWRAASKKEYYMNAQEALELGLIDEIIPTP